MLRRVAPFVLASLVFAAPAGAGPVLLDRVVAIVDDHGIYRSEVIARANGPLVQMDPKDRADPKKVETVLKATLAKMIDEAIISREAQRFHISVSADEVEMALGAIAKRFQMDRAALLDVAKKQGMPEAEYRAELRLKILEGKWIQLRVKPRIKEPLGGTEEEKNAEREALTEAEKQKQLAQLRADSFVEVHW